MPDEQPEPAEAPGEMTERFQAFARSADPTPSRRPSTGVLVTAVVVLVAVIALFWVLVAM